MAYESGRSGVSFGWDPRHMLLMRYKAPTFRFSPGYSSIGTQMEAFKMPFQGLPLRISVDWGGYRELSCGLGGI